MSTPPIDVSCGWPPPDEDGSPYLAAKIDQAQDVLIDVRQQRTKPAAIDSASPKRLPKS